MVKHCSADLLEVGILLLVFFELIHYILNTNMNQFATTLVVARVRNVERNIKSQSRDKNLGGEKKKVKKKKLYAITVLQKEKKHSLKPVL